VPVMYRLLARNTTSPMALENELNSQLAKNKKAHD